MLSLDEQNHWREVYRRENPGWRPATEVYAALVREQLIHGERLLDLGCGRGGVVEQLELDSTTAIGVDPDWLSLYEHRTENFPRATAISEKLPFTGGAFSIVVASWLLEHLPAPQITWSEVSRVLRPGGSFIFITPNAQHPLTWFNHIFGRLGHWQGRLVSSVYNRAENDTFPTTYRANTATAIATLSKRTNMEVEILVSIPDPTYLAFSPLMFRMAGRFDRLLAHDRHIHLVGLIRKPV